MNRLSPGSGRHGDVEELFAMVVGDDVLAEHLDVYDTKTGLWSPDHGDVAIPDGWELLPSGDAFMSRRVKAGVEATFGVSTTSGIDRRVGAVGDDRCGPSRGGGHRGEVTACP